jgi:hypothetical protein
MLATVSPRNNLAHYFHCKKNINLLSLSYDFRTAVSVVERLLKRYEALQRKETPSKE